MRLFETVATNVRASIYRSSATALAQERRPSEVPMLQAVDLLYTKTSGDVFNSAFCLSSNIALCHTYGLDGPAHQNYALTCVHSITNVTAHFSVAKPHTHDPTNIGSKVRYHETHQATNTGNDS